MYFLTQGMAVVLFLLIVSLPSHVQAHGDHHPSSLEAFKDHITEHAEQLELSLSQKPLDEIKILRQREEILGLIEGYQHSVELMASENERTELTAVLSQNKGLLRQAVWENDFYKSSAIFKRVETLPGFSPLSVPVVNIIPGW